jgi:thiamine-phosphate pyrophosphorylase
VRRIGFALYLVTDGESFPEERLLAALAAVPAGGAAVQLRNKALALKNGRAFLRLAERLRKLTGNYAAPLFINDRVDVALATGADGVHLPGHGLPAALVRQCFGPGLLLSAASHSLAEASALIAAGADCVTFGPVWPTASKPEDKSLPLDLRVEPVGPAELRRVCAAVAAPVFALGGVSSPERAAICAAASARVACLSAILGAPDSAAAAAAMYAALMAGSAGAAPR